MKSSRYGSFSDSPVGFVIGVVLQRSQHTGSYIKITAAPHHSANLPWEMRANMSGFDFRQAQRLTGEARHRNLYATKADV
jgi:hypothetical protein